MLEYSEIITYVFAVGAAQAVFLFFILQKKKENRFANKFLAATMLIFALDLLGGILYLSGFIHYIPWYLGLNSAFPYLYGPLIYLFVIFLIHKREAFSKYDYLHFAPFIMIQIYGLFFFYFEGREYQLSLLNFSKNPPWHIELIGILIPFHGFTYMLFTIIEAIKYNKKIKNSFSNIEKIELNWLLHLVAGTAIIWLVVILAYTLNVIYGDEFQANLLIYITISIFLYIFAFKSYKQTEVKPVENYSEESYKKSGMTNEQAELYLSKLKQLINDEKPYRDEKLSLSQLAEKLDISNHNLSEVINRRLEKNFYDFINSYRVQEVKKLIVEDKNTTYSILAHAYEAGFSSKSAFYSAFKKFTGQTPTQYRKEIL